MKRKLLIALVFVCAAMLSGCDSEGRLYPVQGPLAAQQPTPSFPIQFTKVFGGTGGFSTTLANGEAFKGTWTKFNYTPTNGTDGTGTGSSQNLASAWDVVYGSGYYTGHVLGQRIFFSGSAKGNHGTTLRIEEYDTETGSSKNPIFKTKGVAVDSNGNIYKLAF
jgi:hypothetical protein